MTNETSLANDPTNRRAIVETAVRDLALFLGVEFSGTTQEAIVVDDLTTFIIEGFFPANESPTRDKLYLDVFNTAIEHGINYWAAVSDYHCSEDDDALGDTGFYAIINDQEDENEPEYRVDRAVIARGMKLIATGQTDINQSIQSAISRAISRG